MADVNVSDVSWLWSRIESWLDVHARGIAADLSSPAAEGEIQLTESLSGNLPEDVRQLFLRHDGQRGSAHGVFGQWSMMSLKQVRKTVSLLRTLESEGAFAGVPGAAVGPVEPVWWCRGWVPLLSNGSGDYVCSDLTPRPGGDFGQMIIYYSRSDKRSVCAPGIRDWLARYVDDLESGRMGCSDSGRIIRIA